MIVGINRTITDLTNPDGPIRINLTKTTRLLSIGVDDGKIYATVENIDHSKEILVFSATDGKRLGKIVISGDP